MDFFPNFGRPYFYTQNRYINPNRRNPYYESSKERDIYSDERLDDTQDVRSSYNTNNKQKDSTSNQRDNEFLEIFGIKLSFDDILIIALIFFLYNEGVRDNMLFISLILILLS